MSSYRFTLSQRTAIHRAYDEKCFYCGKLLTWRELTIDHVLPERLLGDPEGLRRIRVEYELDSNFPNFSINDYCNWVPAHSDCNSRKGADIYPKKATLFFLREVQKRLPRVEKELSRCARHQRRGRILGNLAIAYENGDVSSKEIIALMQELEYERIHNQPIVITFGLVIEEVLQSGMLGKDISKEEPYLYDWLENNLVNQLRALLSCSFHYTEPSLRDGECLSVRLVFPGLDLIEIRGFYSPWWEILEATSYYEIYGITYEEAYGTP